MISTALLASFVLSSVMQLPFIAINKFFAATFELNLKMFLSNNYLGWHVCSVR